MKKRCFSLLLAILLCICVVPTAAAASAEISVTPSVETVKEGDTFTVTAEISGNSGFSAVQFTLMFDESKVECVSASTGTLLKGMLSATNPSAKDGAIVAAASSSEVNGDGVLATFTFRALSDVGSAFQLADIVLSDSDGGAVPCFSTGGKVGTGSGTVVKPSDPKPETKPEPKPETKPETKPEEKPEQPAQPVQPPAEHKFSDTAGHWAESYINTAVERGYFQGYPDGSYKPGNKVTRGAYVTVLWRMAGKPEPTGTASFADTASLSAEFRKAIAWASEKGLVGGYADGTFKPGDPVTRQAAMKILYYYAGGVSGQETMFTQIYDDHFTDSGALASWAKAPMYWAIYNELISGTSATTLGVTGTANRAQLAKILVNYADKLGGQ